MFTRIGAAAFKKDLNNTITLCDLLDQPHRKFTSVHIAGTNGKGSTSHMLASVLQEAGYKTGLYTSPHLKDFRERIRINGAMIPEQVVIDFVEAYQEHFDRISPSFFEWTVALCFDYFAAQQVDVAIIETGLGGRLDSTNVITPVLSVITNIGWDHTDMLGDTLAKIAGEKAGIIKPGIPVVIGQLHDETLPVFQATATHTGSEMLIAENQITFTVTEHNNNFLQGDVYIDGDLLIKQLTCDLVGVYQYHNIRTVIASLLRLKKAGYRITEEHIRKGLANVKQNTGLRGRWEVLGNHPLVVADTGHNTDGIAKVLEQISAQSYQKLHMVIGMVKDKDISKVLAMLPQNAVYYFTQADIPRALPAQDLSTAAAEYELNGKVYASVGEAKEAAIKEAGPDDMIFIGGSTFIVAEAL